MSQTCDEAAKAAVDAMLKNMRNGSRGGAPGAQA